MNPAERTPKNVIAKAHQKPEHCSAILERWTSLREINAMIKKIVVQNFRIFRDFSIEFTDGMNIIVGDNDVGKSSLLDAVNRSRGRLQGRSLLRRMSRRISFNMEATEEYCAALVAGSNPTPPELIVDLYLTEAGSSVILLGTNNTLAENAYGLRFRACFNDEYAKEYESSFKIPPP